MLVPRRLLLSMAVSKHWHGSTSWLALSAAVEAPFDEADAVPFDEADGAMQD